MTVGRYSLWWQDTPRYLEHRVGVIGHYAVNDRSAADRVLNQACLELADKGCSLAVGPMDGNTWRPYRLVTEFGVEPNFFLEPRHPPEWPSHFCELGFRPLARYVSALNTDLAFRAPRLKRITERLAVASVRIRSLDLQHWERDLRDIWTIAKVSFRKNILYTDIDEEEFFSQCDALRSVIDPRLVLIATLRERPVGFLFAIPDVLQVDRRSTINTVIVKSLAVLPDRRFAGLGHLLLAKSHAAAQRLGFSRVIHALMRENSLSHRLSQQYAQTMRRYTLFAKELGV
jgi:GNAT superfamily N-acetyltransferase